MALAQGSCDAQREDGQELDCAHSSDFRRQPRTVWGGRRGGQGEGKIDKVKCETVKERSHGSGKLNCNDFIFRFYFCKFL